MSERKTWTQYEDFILKDLREGKKMQRWSEISLKMQKEYGINQRTGKQCRERYENHLKKGIDKGPWTFQEQAKLLKLHLQHGNKWVYIADQIKQYGNFRTGNHAKNYFMSLIKKSLKNFNSALLSLKHPGYRTLPLSFISKLLRIQADCRFCATHKEAKKSDICKQIENNLMVFRQEPKEENQSYKQGVKQLFEKIKQLKAMLRKPRSRKIQIRSEFQFEQLDPNLGNINEENSDEFLKTKKTNEELNKSTQNISLGDVMNSEEIKKRPFLIKKEDSKQNKDNNSFDGIFIEPDEISESQDSIQRCFAEIQDFFQRVKKHK